MSVSIKLSTELKSERLLKIRLKKLLKDTVPNSKDSIDRKFNEVKIIENGERDKAKLGNQVSCKNGTHTSEESNLKNKVEKQKLARNINSLPSKHFLPRSHIKINKIKRNKKSSKKPKKSIWNETGILKTTSISSVYNDSIKTFDKNQILLTNEYSIENEFQDALSKNTFHKPGNCNLSCKSKFWNTTFKYDNNIHEESMENDQDIIHFDSKKYNLSDREIKDDFLCDNGGEINSDDKFVGENSIYSNESEETSFSFYNEDIAVNDYNIPGRGNQYMYIHHNKQKFHTLDEHNIPVANEDSSAEIFQNQSYKVDNTDSDNSCPELVPITSNIYTKKNIRNKNSSFKRKIYETMPQVFDARKKMGTPIENIENFIKYGTLLKMKREHFINSMTSLSPVQMLKNFTLNECNKVITISNAFQNFQNVKNSQTDFIQHVNGPSSKEFAKFYNSFNLRYVLLLLRSEIYFHGTVKIKLIAGNAEIFGYRFQQNEIVEAFSPRGNSLLQIKAMKDSITQKNYLKNSLDAFTNEFLRTDLNEIIELYENHKHAVLLLERNDRDNKIIMIKKYMKENVFPNMNVLNLNHKFYASEFILRSVFYEKCLNNFKINPLWENITVQNISKILIVGGKNVGKSTLVRYLINRHLKTFGQFLLIDLDIGQPECFLPQTVSATLIKRPMLGPGFFYNLHAEKSFIYGDVNVIVSPINYIKNVKALIDYCKNENSFKTIPWIVNTMGYNKGFGAELIAVIVQHLKPTDVIQLQSSKTINNFDFILSSDIIHNIPRNIFIDEKCKPIKYNLIMLDSVQNFRSKFREWNMSPKDFRFLTIMTRFGVSAVRTEWLTNSKPFCAYIDDLEIFCFGENKVCKESLLNVINGNMVYLCRKSSQLFDCFGIGIVHSIDRVCRKLYLLPSLQSHNLCHVNALAVGNIPLPTSIVLNQGPQIKGVVPYTFNTLDFISSKHIYQIMHRSQQFPQGIDK